MCVYVYMYLRCGCYLFHEQCRKQRQGMCVYVRMYVYMYGCRGYQLFHEQCRGSDKVCVHEYMHGWMCICMDAWMCICMYAWMDVHLFGSSVESSDNVCMYVYTYIYIQTYVQVEDKALPNGVYQMHIFTCIYGYIYIYIYLYIHAGSG